MGKHCCRKWSDIHRIVCQFLLNSYYIVVLPSIAPSERYTKSAVWDTNYVCAFLNSHNIHVCVVGNEIIGLFFLINSITCISNTIILRNEIWYLHDGASAHFSEIGTKWLDRSWNTSAIASQNLYNKIQKWSFMKSWSNNSGKIITC